jgi:galactonate dehydratase
MHIASIEPLQADGGWRRFSFLKVTTDEGLVGWSEYAESYWSPGLTELIRRLAPSVIGEDPRAVGRLSARLHAMTRLTAGGLLHQAIAAVENACLDIKAKALGVPVYALVGGPYRDRIPLYWSHFGTFRARYPAHIGAPPLRTLDDLQRLAQEAVTRGFRALKTNPLVFDGAQPRMLDPGFGPRPGELAQNFDTAAWDAVDTQMAALREATGPHTGLMLDLNFGLKPEGQARALRLLERHRLEWLEMDTSDPAALAQMRAGATTPIASLESLHGRRAYRPFLERQAVDVAIVDVPWNGFLESVKIAALAEAHEVNVAPHNFCGHLYTMINAHFAAAVPNLRIMEIEVDDVPWRDGLYTAVPIVERGELVVPDAPGWGVEVDEAALRERPPR